MPQQPLSIVSVEDRTPVADLRIVGMEDVSPAVPPPTPRPVPKLGEATLTDVILGNLPQKPPPSPQDVTWRVMEEQPGLLGFGAKLMGLLPSGVRDTLMTSTARVGFPLAASPTGPGGMAVAGAAGEALAEMYEGRNLNPKQIAVQGALSGIPVFGSASTPVKTAVSRGVQGGLLGGVGAAGTALAEGETPTLKDVATATALGTALGGVGGTVEARLNRGRVTPTPAPTQTDAPPMVPRTEPMSVRPQRIPEIVEVIDIPPVTAAERVPPPKAAPSRRQQRESMLAEFGARGADEATDVRTPHAVDQSAAHSGKGVFRREPVVGTAPGGKTGAKLADLQRKGPRSGWRNERGEINPELIAGVTGAVGGGAAGGTQGDTPQERIQNAILLGATGAAGVALGASAARGRANRAAMTDELTGIGNRRAWQQAGEQPGRIVARIDLDNFKALNDTQGHAAGDEALKTVAEALRSRLRAGDEIARLGGDEFGIRLGLERGSDPAQLAAFRDELETTVDQALGQAGLAQAGGKRVGASIGFGADEAAADAAAMARKQERGVSQPRGDSGVAPHLEQSPNLGKQPQQSPRTVEQTAKTLGRPIPPQRPLTRERIEGEGVMISKMPEPVRKGVAEVIEKNQHFEAQRRGVQPVARTQALADYITVEANKTLPKGTALNAEETTAYARAVATVQDEIDRLSAKVVAGEASPLDMARLAKAQQEQVVQTASFLGARAETGRALNAHRQLVELFESHDVKGIQEALKSERVQKDLKKFAEEWSKLPDDRAKLDYLRNLKQNTWLDTFQAVYYSNILSGVKTHLRNVIGNTANGVFSNLSTIPAVGYDIVRSAVTGKQRTIFAGELAPRAVGTALGVKQGIDDALFTLQHGYTPKALSTFDVPRPELAGGGKNPFNWTGRALEAEDQFFYGIAYNQELYSRIYARARGEAAKKGLKGDALGRFVEQRMAELKLHPPKDVTDAAEQAAKRMVFKEDPGEWTQWLMAGKEKGNLGKLMTFVLPFVRTPANIIRQGIENTPLAPLTKQTRQAFKAGGRESAEAFGRMTTGTVGLAALAYWAAQGKVSGKGPSDPEERAALMESGWRPNSVKIGDTWVDYTNLVQPLSQALFAVSNAYEQYHREGTPPNPAEVAAATGGAMLSQSFLSGLSDLNMALSDPGRYGERYVSRVGQGFVPFSGLSRNVAQAIDPVVRDAGDVRSIIPGLSQQAEPKLDRFGQDVTRPGTAFDRGLSPVGRSEESRDPVVVELGRLKVSSLGLPPKSLPATRTSPKIELTIDERRQMGQAVRQALERLFKQPNWQRLDEDRARDRVSDAVRRARSQQIARIRAARRRSPE